MSDCQGIQQRHDEMLACPGSKVCPAVVGISRTFPWYVRLIERTFGQPIASMNESRLETWLPYSFRPSHLPTFTNCQLSITRCRALCNWPAKAHFWIPVESQSLSPQHHEWAQLSFLLLLVVALIPVARGAFGTLISLLGSASSPGVSCPLSRVPGQSDSSRHPSKPSSRET
jgi:hypothetical protein